MICWYIYDTTTCFGQAVGHHQVVCKSIQRKCDVGEGQRMSTLHEIYLKTNQMHLFMDVIFIACFMLYTTCNRNNIHK
jgi:hypothetical protein